MKMRELSWQRWGLILLAAVIFTLAPWSPQGRASAGEPAAKKMAPDLHLLTSSQGEVVFELRVPAWDAKTQRAAELDTIAVPGFSQTSAPGTPRLPVKVVTLGIPPGAKPRVKVVDKDEPRVASGYRLPANPHRSLDIDPSGPVSHAALTGPPPAPQLEPATGDAFYPAELAEVAEVGQLRSQPFVQIRLNPFQYHPAKQELRVYERLRVAVTFDAPAASAAVDEGPFEPLLRSLLFNYDQARAWRVPATPSAQAATQAFYAGVRYRIEVSREGIYEITRGSLPNLTQEPKIQDYALDTFQLFEDFNLSPDKEVALEIADKDGDGNFDFEDAVYFYGRGPDPGEQKYTDTRVYWLVAGREAGKRMDTRSATSGSGTPAPDFPTTVHAEQNKLYWSNSPTEGEPDPHWFYEPRLTHTGSASSLKQEFSISTPGRTLNDYDVVVRARVVGFASDPQVNPDHLVYVYLNGTFIRYSSWDGRVGEIIEGNGAPLNLNAGQNEIGIQLHLAPGTSADSILVDWFEIDYRRSFEASANQLIFNRSAGYSAYQITGFDTPAVTVYDITDPQNPVRLAGTKTSYEGNTLGYVARFQDTTASAQRFIAASAQAPDSILRADASVDLRAPAGGGADYVIITHPDFAIAADRLKNYRATHFTPRVVQVDDVYNQFGNGVLDPEAIHDFLAYAYDNWSPRPQYVVLLGDGTYDFHNYLEKGRKNYIPPYLAMVDPWMGETADENYYAAVEGSDIVPDLFVGRLPANSLTQANAMVDKIVAYEAGTARPPKKILLAADDADGAGDFPTSSDELANAAIPYDYTLTKVYLGLNSHETPGSARAAVIDAINQGQRFVNYRGHSGIAEWADEGLLTNTDVAGLSNEDEYPIMLGMTCLEGSFHDAVQDAVAESLVRAANKGAIASWSATGLGVETRHDVLNRSFYDALFKNGVRRLGPAIGMSKAQYLSEYPYEWDWDLIHTFALLGDPALDTGIVGSLADINADGKVDVGDLTTLEPFWRRSTTDPDVPGNYDQDGNGFIDIRDFMLITRAWN